MDACLATAGVLNGLLGPRPAQPAELDRPDASAIQLRRNVSPAGRLSVEAEAAWKSMTPMFG